LTAPFEAVFDTLEETHGYVLEARLKIAPTSRDRGEQPYDVPHVVESLASGVREGGETRCYRVIRGDAAAGEVALEGEMAEARAEFIVEVTGDAAFQLLPGAGGAATLGEDDDDGDEGDEDNGETGTVEPAPKEPFTPFRDEDGECVGPGYQFFTLRQSVEPDLPC
jgi:hypothetical protein